MRQSTETSFSCCIYQSPGFSTSTVPVDKTSSNSPTAGITAHRQGLSACRQVKNMRPRSAVTPLQVLHTPLCWLIFLRYDGAHPCRRRSCETLVTILWGEAPLGRLLWVCTHWLCCCLFELGLVGLAWDELISDVDSANTMNGLLRLMGGWWHIDTNSILNEYHIPALSLGALQIPSSKNFLIYFL